jgi:hypothetical protein
VLNIRNERGLYYQPYRNIKDFKGISWNYLPIN